MLIHQIARKHLSKAVYFKGGDGGAGAQAKATQKGIDLQREMWQTNMQNLAPFTPMAQQYVHYKPNDVFVYSKITNKSQNTRISFVLVERFDLYIK